MNEDEVAEGCVPPAEMDFFENTSKDSILDAKYYLVRPKGSKTVYIMDLSITRDLFIKHVKKTCHI